MAAAAMYLLANRDWGTGSRGEGYIVCLDAGHGGEDPGASALGYLESEDTLAMTLQVAKYLEKQGCTVVLTRSDDSYPSLDERVEIANAAGADALVSIHRNMQEADPSTNGVEAWIHSAQPENARILSQAILDRIAETGTMDVTRGVRSGTAGNPTENYRVNVKSHMASCILELGFISNEQDNTYYHNYEKVLAKAIANGILDGIERNAGASGDA